MKRPTAGEIAHMQPIGWCVRFCIVEHDSTPNKSSPTNNTKACTHKLPPNNPHTHTHTLELEHTLPVSSLLLAIPRIIRHRSKFLNIDLNLGLTVIGNDQFWFGFIKSFNLLMKHKSFYCALLASPFSSPNVFEKTSDLFNEFVKTIKGTALGFFKFNNNIMPPAHCQPYLYLCPPLPFPLSENCLY